MKIEKNTVYSFKLNSGEEVIGKVIRVCSDHYEVDSALSTGMTQQGVQLMPAMLTTPIENECNMYFNSISMAKLPRTEVLDAYRESTTGITVPEPKILLG